jgi:hypothetical protein
MLKIFDYEAQQMDWDYSGLLGESLGLSFFMN